MEAMKHKKVKLFAQNLSVLLLEIIPETWYQILFFNHFLQESATLVVKADDSELPC